MTTPTAATLMAGIQRMADVAQRRHQPEPLAMVLVREIRRLEHELERAENRAEWNRMIADNNGFCVQQRDEQIEALHNENAELRPALETAIATGVVEQVGIPGYEEMTGEEQ